MIVRELFELKEFTCLTPLANTDMEIKGVYVGDLLSWVMANGESQQAWVTVQGHINIVAVAMLREFSCIIVSDDASISEDTIQKANEEKLCILKTSLTAFEVCKKFIELKI